MSIVVRHAVSRVSNLRSFGRLSSLSGIIAILALAMAMTSSARAAVVDFSTLTDGVTTYAADGDGDGIADVDFSTTDPSGFSLMGPGLNQSFVNEPALEGNSGVTGPDVRVDFRFGAFGPITFGFAFSETFEVANAVTLSVFGFADELLLEVSADALFTLPDGINQSDFPEGQLVADFGSAGASYALFEFADLAGNPRFIIDDFSGIFGSTEPTPLRIAEPATLAMFGMGLLGLLAGHGRRRRLTA